MGAAMQRSLERVVVQRGGRWVAIWVEVADDLHPGAVPGLIKAEARRRILDRVPEWRQVNLAARMIELMRLGADQWTPEQQAEAAQIEALWSWVKAIRARSDELEAETAGKPIEQIEALGLLSDATWAVD
jgi:hypothetical protein